MRLVIDTCTSAALVADPRLIHEWAVGAPPVNAAVYEPRDLVPALSFELVRMCRGLFTRLVPLIGSAFPLYTSRSKNSKEIEHVATIFPRGLAPGNVPLGSDLQADLA